MCDPALKPGTDTEKIKEDPFNVKFWSDRWSENRIGWHKNAVNPHLLKYIENITGQNLSLSPVTDSKLFEENSKKTWFVPLCGKTLDIPYLLSQGFRVFGIEAVKHGIDELNSENSLNMKYDENTKLYTGANGRLQIYIGDLFTFPVEQFCPFDYVWDRGSFIAIEYPFRKEYAEVMKRAMKNSDGTWYNFNYLLSTLLYDKSKYEGPPRSVTDEDMLEYYDPWSNYKILLSEKDDGNSPWHKTLNGEVLHRLFHITPKTE